AQSHRARFTAREGVVMLGIAQEKMRAFKAHKQSGPGVKVGDKAVCEITRQEIQVYVAHLTQEGYAPKSIDHIHDVLSAVLRTAVKWGHLQENPARGVDLPKLRNVRPKWALTTLQAEALLNTLPPLARTMVGLALLSGLRRAGLFVLRWLDLADADQSLT